MALIYRGRKFDAHTAVANTAETATHGTYRGVSVAFRSATQEMGKNASTKQYRGVTY